MFDKELIIEKVADTVVKAGSTFKKDKKQAYKRAIEKEIDDKTKWVLENVLENAEVAEKNRSPLCDDTGIPHLFLEVGKNRAVSGELLDIIKQGVYKGLNKLPGRPMAIQGDDFQRIDQSGGLSEDPGDLEASPILIKYVDEDVIRLHIMMFGGGPAIRAKTLRVFHKHNVDVVKEEIINWASKSAGQLGCTPCVLAVGIGRSHFEASSMMMEALVYSDFNKQSDFENSITDAVNKTNIGALGLGGKTTALATFVKVGPQRASGVRIVCMRPCCCFEPRIASVEL